jgi:hypothetical protein
MYSDGLSYLSAYFQRSPVPASFWFLLQTFLRYSFISHSTAKHLFLHIYVGRFDVFQFRISVWNNMSYRHLTRLLEQRIGQTRSVYSILLWLYSPLLGLGRFFSFLILYTVGRTAWTEDQVARPLPTQRTTQTQNKRTQIFMPRAGFEPTIPLV